MNDTTLLALAGLVTGGGLGLSAKLGRFCSLGAIEDILYGGRYYRLLMWPVAIGVAMFGIGIMMIFSDFNPSNTLYLGFVPNYPAHIIGGALFGFGMALAGICGFTGLARIGTGDMRALFIITVMGISSYVISSGVLAPLREILFHYNRVTNAVSFSAPTYLVLGAIIALLPLLRSNFRNSRAWFWGALVGLCIVLGWLATSIISEANLNATPITSHTFSLPLGETLLYVMISTGTSLTFGIGSIAGVILGGFIGALIKGEFSWEACDDARELRRHIFGGFLMGTGAVIGFGCSIGQGLSALSVLYFGAPVTLIAICAGAYVGLRYLVEG